MEKRRAHFLKVAEEITPQVVLDSTRYSDEEPSHPEPEKPFNHCDTHDEAGVEGELLRRHFDGQIVDLYGIDAPELGFNGVEQTCQRDGQTYRCALIAAGRLAEKIAGRTVSCEAHATDAEGRMLASCFIKKREDLSGWLVNKGFVVVDSRYSEKFTDWEIWNQAAGSGLWSGPFELPWLWRAQNE